MTSDKKKPHFLKVDFNKWTDEDNGNLIICKVIILNKKNHNQFLFSAVSGDEEDRGQTDLLKNLQQFQNTDSSKHSFDDLDDQSEDSDDEELPNLI